jgi:hypothetical protein
MISNFLNYIRNLTIYSFVLLLFLSVFSFVIKAKDYRGIRPLKTTRAEVEKRFGKPDKYGNYKIDGELFNIYYGETYRNTPCDNKDNCECLVSPDTVLQIRVYIHYDLKLKQLHLQLNRYKKSLDTHLLGLVVYSSDSEGIVYEVNKNEKNRVRAITYLPSSKDCQNLLKKSRVERNNT